MGRVDGRVSGAVEPIAARAAELGAGRIGGTAHPTAGREGMAALPAIVASYVVRGAAVRAGHHRQVSLLVRAGTMSSRIRPNLPGRRGPPLLRLWSNPVHLEEEPSSEPQTPCRHGGAIILAVIGRSWLPGRRTARSIRLRARPLSVCRVNAPLRQRLPPSRLWSRSPNRS